MKHLIATLFAVFFSVTWTEFAAFSTKEKAEQAGVGVAASAYMHQGDAILVRIHRSEKFDTEAEARGYAAKLSDPDNYEWRRYMDIQWPVKILKVEETHNETEIK